METGKIIRIAGPVVGATGMTGLRLFDVVLVGEMRLVGEVIRLSAESAIIQVYEDTSGVRIGEPVYVTGTPLVAHLGPGLLGCVYDGLQRPLKAIASEMGSFIQRGVRTPSLPQDRLWDFTAAIQEGSQVEPGDILGAVPESKTIEHRLLVPNGLHGRVVQIKNGRYHCEDVVAVIEPSGNHQHKHVGLSLVQRWPVRQPRPVHTRLPQEAPIVTGTRVIDVLFPLAKGGSAIIPGGFGTGKTVVEQSLARWADVDVVVYVGCGERGNEMTDVLEEFPKLEDPRTGTPLMERTVLIANTSNMPVAAREASIYTGITIAEYYRDMGYDVLLLADSTSRWGEALREISGRLEEMPGEEGYPAYLAARLAEFYERSGRVITLGGVGKEHQESRCGSVSVVGAVSPPGGDFSEPMTQNSMRVVGTFWALDYSLSRARHFPAIHWVPSYSLYDLHPWYCAKISEDWTTLTTEASALLQREVELLEIVQLVGPDALAETERGVLTTARMLREDFLQQSAFHEIDRFCPIEKAYWMLKTILEFHRSTQAAIQADIGLEKIAALSVVNEIARMKEIPPEKAEQAIRVILDHVKICFSELGVEVC